MKPIFKFLVSVIFLTISGVCSAQSDGDNLFMEGQRYQQTQTIAAQNKAIRKFQAAKVVYTTSSKKKMCDNQIKICRNNIALLQKKIRQEKIKEREKAKKETRLEKAEETVADTVVATHTNVRLSLSETRLDFKYKPKEGATQSVEVMCNYDDWEVASKPSWVTVYMATGKFSVEAQTNDTSEERSGVIKIKCGDKVADLVVNQDKAGALQKIGKIFKKKKNK